MRDPGWKIIQMQDLESGSRMNTLDFIFETFVSVFGVKNT
jgi:hypothetical protein